MGPWNPPPSRRPSRSRPNAPPGGSGCRSANPAARSATLFSKQACSDVWYTTAGRSGTAWSRSSRVGCRPSRSRYSTYPLPVTHEPAGVRALASRSRAWMAGMSGADGWLQSAPAARYPMSATWQCASISPGSTVAPSSRATAAPGPAAARTCPGLPTAAIRPSRTSMAPAVPPSGAMVTMTASSMTSSTRRTLRRTPPARQSRAQVSRSGGLAAGREFAGANRGGLVLALDKVAVAEGRDAGDNQGQRQRLAGQVQDPGLDVLIEQEQPEQAGRQRVQDGEPGLRRGQRAGSQRVRGQQQGRRSRPDQDVQRPVGHDGLDAVAQVRAELLDHRGDEAPGHAGGRAEHRGAARGGGTGTAAQPERDGQGAQHHAERRQAGQPPQVAGRVQPAPRRGRGQQEQAQPGAHGDRGQPVTPLHPA